uniref:KilA-N domain-containing protein n=1 Tax=Bacteroides nordii TaxID=291645 RepID=UPI002A91E077|nr:KilA-N domain-containing protein [Bacteroides nordii]
METKICIFKENPITFVLDKNNGMMVNATEMAKPFGKKVNEFMSNEGTKAFVNEALNNGNSRYLKLFSQSDLYYSSQNTGTWMHRVLAIKFAAWLNPAFEIWVYSTIERILFGKHAQREESLERSLKFQNESKQLKDKADKTGEDFTRYLELERQLKYEKSLRKSLTAAAVTEMRSLFEEDEE